jgi:NTP pyrophosphatase (non-canonical NTP hydrolase)
MWVRTEARDQAIGRVLLELDRQLELKASGKFTNTCEDMADHPYEALPILLEEFGELGRAMQTGDEENFKEELTQIAAIALAWLSGIEKRDLEYVI